MRIDRAYIKSIIAEVGTGRLAEVDQLKAAVTGIGESLLKLDEYVGELEIAVAAAAAGKKPAKINPYLVGLAQQLYLHAMSPALGEFNADLAGRARRIREDAFEVAEVFFKELPAT